MNGLVFGVVTKIPSMRSQDAYLNAAVCGPIWECNPYNPEQPLRMLAGAVLTLRTRVFELGEILICNERGGREIVGHGRNVSKWGVDTEWFETIEAAVEHSQKVAASETSVHE